MGMKRMDKSKCLLPIEAVKIMLEQGIYLKDVSRASGYSLQELSMMLKIWGLKRKRGPKAGWKQTNARA